jgi:hypothetical protein
VKLKIFDVDMDLVHPFGAKNVGPIELFSFASKDSVTLTRQFTQSFIRLTFCETCVATSLTNEDLSWPWRLHDHAKTKIMTSLHKPVSLLTMENVITTPAGM